jgi:energy-coupling factor transporter ATP-binding protein EcfA2
MSKQEKIERVNIVIGQLGLEGCRNTRIGDEIDRGISGGERKRVSIGIELVTNPKILFLDEPTSGLDAFNAFNAMETLKKLAKKENKIILVTIHQPRTDILELFDKIILLSMGKMVWFGPTQGCIEHFAKVGYPLPPKTNPSDFFLDTITVDRRSTDLYEKSKLRIEKFVQAYTDLNLELDSTPKNSQEGDVAVSKKERFSLSSRSKVEWPSTWIGEFLVLSDRNLTNDFRDKATLGASIGQNICVAIIICSLFAGVKNDAAGIQNRLGCFFFLCLNLTFGIIGPNIGKFPDQKRIIKRERAAGSYRSSSAFLSKIASSIPLIIIGNLILAVPVYWAVGLAATARQFFIFLLIVFVHSNTANNLGFLIGASVPNATVGQIVMPLIIIVFMLFGGLLINLDSITIVLRWIQWISLISHTYKV